MRSHYSSRHGIRANCVQRLNRLIDLCGVEQTSGPRAPLHRLLPEPRGLVPLQPVQIVRAPDEEEVRDLLDDFQRVRDAAGSERVPDLVNLVLDGSRNHGVDRAAHSTESVVLERVVSRKADFEQRARPVAREIAREAGGR